MLWQVMGCYGPDHPERPIDASAQEARVRERRLSTGIGLLAVAAVVGSIPIGAAAAPAQQRSAPPTLGEAPPAEYAQVDNRPGALAPSSAQRSHLARSGVTARWNKLGTPAALSAPDGVLASGLAKDPVVAARQYLSGSTRLFGLDQKSVNALETVATHRVG